MSNIIDFQKYKDAHDEVAEEFEELFGATEPSDLFWSSDKVTKMLASLTIYTTPPTDDEK